MDPTTQSGTAPRPEEEDAVLTKAVQRVGERLAIAQKDLAAILGVSAATLSRVGSQKRRLAARSKEGELALLVIRIYRSLDTLVGGDDLKARQWLAAENRHLGGVPLRLMHKVEGLVRVAEYLDALRGKV